MSAPGAKWWHLPQPIYTTASGSFPHNETVCMLMVSWSCYHPQTPIKPHELQWSQRQQWIQKYHSHFIDRVRPQNMMLMDDNDINICTCIHQWVISLKENKYCIFCQQALAVFFKWVINGSIHKKLIQDVPLWVGSNFPRCFCCSSVFCLEGCQVSPLRYPRILWAKLIRMRSPCSHYSQTWTAAHLGDAHSHTVKAPFLTCSLIGSAGFSHVTLQKKNSDSSGQKPPLIQTSAKAAEGLTSSFW